MTWIVINYHFTCPLFASINMSIMKEIVNTILPFFFFVMLTIFPAIIIYFLYFLFPFHISVTFHIINLLKYFTAHFWVPDICSFFFFCFWHFYMLTSTNRYHKSDKLILKEFLKEMKRCEPTPLVMWWRTIDRLAIIASNWLIINK